MRRAFGILFLLVGLLGFEFDHETHNPHVHPDGVKMVKPRSGCNRDGCDLDGNHIHANGNHEELPIGENEFPGSPTNWIWFRVLWGMPSGKTVGQNVQMTSDEQATKFAHLKAADLGADAVLSVRKTETPWNASGGVELLGLERQRL